MVELSMTAVRLDKWLWAARFYKTRAIAKKMIEQGRVIYNGQRSKPGRLVEIGATIRLQQGMDEKTVIVRATTDKRQSAPLAQQLYRETEQSIQQRQQAALLRKSAHLLSPRPHSRPDKKQRRQIIRLKHHD